MRRCYDCGCEVKPGCDVCPDCGSTHIETIDYRPEPVKQGHPVLITLIIIAIIFIIIIFAP